MLISALSYINRMQWRHTLYSVSTQLWLEACYRLRQMWKQWSETEYKRNSMPSRYPNAIPSAFRFLGRQRHSYQRQDKGGERHGNAFVILYLKFLNIGKAALPLPADVLAQLRLVSISCWFFIIRKSAGSMNRVVSMRPPFMILSFMPSIWRII